MKSVFISHAQRDSDKVRMLASELSKSGLKVFLPNELSFGSDWHAGLTSELRKSSLFIAFISEETSQNVIFELGYALGASKQVLLVGQSLSRIPTDVASFPFIRFDENDPRSVYSIVEGVRTRLESVKVHEPESSDPRNKLKRMLNDREYIEQTSPMEFEEIVAEYFKQLGFFTESIPEHSDGGCDIVLATEDKNSMLAVVQIKKYQAGSLLSVSHVRQLLGSMMLAHAACGILVTTARFSPSSHEVAKRSPKPVLLLTVADLVASSKGEILRRLTPR